MYSQCPECLARFRVTAAALRTAQGTVRCGRCGSAFNALARLTDTLPDDDDAQPAAALAVPGMASLEPGLLPQDAADGTPRGDGEAAAVPEFHFTAADIEQVFVDARDWQRRFGAAPTDAQEPVSGPAPGSAAGPDEAAAGTLATPAVPPVVVHEPEAVEDITMEGERIVIEGVTDYGDEFFDELLHEAAPLPAGETGPPEPVVDLDSTDRFESLQRVPEPDHPESEPEAVDAAGPAEPGRNLEERDSLPAASAVPSPAAPAAAAAAATTVAAPARPRPSWRDEPAQPVDHLDEFEEESRGTRSTLAWSVVALLLALLLAAQLVHRFRQELARDATVGPLVRQVYAWAGRPLAPNWDPAAYELRQWGAGTQSEGPGRMTVRASVRNRAAIAQPMPLLRLELENRFGDTLARRDFEPREYLKDPAQATRLLDPGGSVEAELALVDVPAEAVGYRLDACLRDERGTPACAQSPPAGNGGAR